MTTLKGQNGLVLNILICGMDVVWFGNVDLEVISTYINCPGEEEEGRGGTLMLRRPCKVIFQFAASQAALGLSNTETVTLLPTGSLDTKFESTET